MNESFLPDDLAVLKSLLPELTVFLAVARQGQLTAGAEEIAMPQPTASRALARLERVLGMQLLVRSGRQIQLTVAARALVTPVQRLVDGLALELRQLRAGADAESGLIRFGFPLSLGASTMPRLLRGFGRKHPKISFELVQSDGDGMLEQVTSGRLDLAVMGPLPAGGEVSSLECAKQRLHLYVPAGHRLASRRRVSFRELGGESFVAPPPHYYLRKISDACFPDGPPEVVFESAEIETLHGLISAGFGLGILPAAEVPRQDTVRVQLIQPVPSRQLGVIWQKGRTLPPVSATFRQYLLTELPALVTG